MGWFRRLLNTVRSNSLDRELDIELEHHVAMRAAEARRAGMDERAAEAQARRRLGNALGTRERTREMDISGFMDSAIKDLRYAARQMRRAPGFTAVAALSLALGIGANTAIFSLINTVVMRSLPVRDPERLVMLTDPESAGVSIGMSTGVRGLLTYSEFQRLRERLDVFDGMFAAESMPRGGDLRINGGEREEARSALVSGEFFNVLGVSPVVGRVFTAEEDKSVGQSPYAVLSYDFWQRRFNRAASALGATIRIGAANLTVIGVAPPGFYGHMVGLKTDLWIPMTMEPLVKPGTDWLHEDLSKDLDKVEWLQVFGRLKPGVTTAQAQAQASVVFKNMIESDYGSVLSEAAKKEALDQQVKLRSAAKGASFVRGQMAEPLYVLLAVVGLVLLIACANIANLMMARAAARSREIGVRVALGAGRSRLIRQTITESLVLAAVGTATGMLIARWGARFLVALNSRPGSPIDFEPEFDVRVLAFTAAVALLTAVLFGLMPALRGTRVDLNDTLKGSGRGSTAGGGRASFAKTLVAVQIGLSLLLLVGAGLFLRTLRNLESVPLGYSRENLVQMNVNGEAGGYTDERRVRLYEDIAERLRRIPGVTAAVYAENGLFVGRDSGDAVEVPGFTATNDRDRGSRFDVIGPGYFSGIGVPMLLGREFGREDVGTKRPLVVINEAFAKKFFAGRNPIGRPIVVSFGDTHWTFEVVGVAANVRDHNLRGDVPHRFYRPPDGGGYVPQEVVFVIRTAGAPTNVMAAARRAVQELNPDIPVTGVRTVAEYIDARVVREKAIAKLSAVFGGIALLLACIGLYGVLSFGVARRTREIGIRMALGARPVAVLRMVLGETGWLIVAGLAGGVAAAFGLTRLIATYLFGVKPLDPLTLAGAAGVLVAVAVVAALLPAQRASRVNPVTALRDE